MGREFNADRRAEAREQAPVTIGGVTFHPVRMSNSTVKKVRKAALDSKAKMEDAGGDEGTEAQEIAFKGLADQVALLLVDADGKAPTHAHLVSCLDQRDAIALLGWLMEDDEEGGNSSTPDQTGTLATTS